MAAKNLMAQGQPPHPNPIIEQLKSAGIPIKIVLLARTVTSASGEPEFRFYTQDSGKEPRKSRIARLWYTPSGVLLEQDTKEGLKHKIIPLANVLEAELL